MMRTEISPCWHMKGMVQGLADGTLRGFLRKYATFHLRYCERCRQAVAGLRAVIARLSRLLKPAEMPTESWSTIASAWDDAESATGPPPE